MKSLRAHKGWEYWLFIFEAIWGQRLPGDANVLSHQPPGDKNTYLSLKNAFTRQPFSKTIGKLRKTALAFLWPCYYCWYLAPFCPLIHF